VQVGKYGLTKFALLSATSVILKEDPIGRELLNSPEDFFANETKKVAICNSLDKFIELMIIDLNDILKHETQEGFLDYKNLFKNKSFIEKITEELLKSYKKDLVRHPESSFESSFNSFLESTN